MAQMMDANRGVSHQEACEFFEAFCLAFPSFDGKVIAARFAVPYLALSADGSLRCFVSQEEIAGYFQGHLDRYRAQGCCACLFDGLTVFAMGRQSALASLHWRLIAESGATVGSWWESYKLVKSPHGLRIYASTDHVEQP